MSKSGKSSYLGDKSWIRKFDDEDEDVDRDPNYGTSVLNKGSTEDSVSSSQTELISPSKSVTTSTSVQSLSKRFGGSQDELSGRSTTTTISRDGGRTTETTITTSTSTQGLRSPGIKSPTTTFSERVLRASNKGAEDKLFDSLLPSIVKDSSSPTDGKSTVSSIETVTVRSSTNGDVKTSTRTLSSAEDDLYDTLLPKAITSALDSPVSSRSSSSSIKREIITVESSRTLESQTLSSPVSGRRTTSYSSYSEDVPSTRSTSYSVSSISSDAFDGDTKTYSYSKPDSSSYEYRSNSPSSYSSTTSTSTYRSSSRSEDLTDPVYSKSSTKTLYSSSSDRAVSEKDLCSFCHKPFTGDAKMVLDDMKINCHVTCFKCEVCKNTLAYLKAGDSMWVYKHMVHCESCFESTRERWRL